MSGEVLIFVIGAVWIGASVLTFAGFALIKQSRRCACGMHKIDPEEECVYDMICNVVHKETACYPKEEML